MDDWFASADAAARVDVPGMLDGDVLARIGDLVADGALLALGLSRDGGALGCTVTLDGRWRREWFREKDQLLGWLDGAAEAVSRAVRAAPPPAVPDNGSRPRRGRSRGL